MVKTTPFLAMTVRGNDTVI